MTRLEEIRQHKQDTEVKGQTTTNQIYHAFHPQPAITHGHPPQSSVCESKPLELVMMNPLPLHDMYVTSNKFFHGTKYHELEHRQPPIQVKPPGLEFLDYVVPDYSRKLAKGNFPLHPINDVSETKAEFGARRRIHDMYGSPSLHISHRDVFLPITKDSVFLFNRDDPYPIVRNTHPYLTSNQATHRKFTSDEARNATMSLEKIRATGREMAIRIRQRPMLDPFEHHQNVPPSVDALRLAPYSFPPMNGQKLLFKVPPYKGCLPRVFPPVIHVGCKPTTETTYERPLSGLSKNNVTSPVKVCYIQPKLSALGAMTVPGMYTTEAKTYGSGRRVGNLVIHLHPTSHSIC